MTLETGEFIRRFLMHVLPKGLHRIRHYGLLTNGSRAVNVARARELLGQDPRPREDEPESAEGMEPGEPQILPRPCPCCGGRLIVIEVFARGSESRHRPSPTRPVIRIDTS